jgi:hypothetical protein
MACSLVFLRRGGIPNRSESHRYLSEGFGMQADLAFYESPEDAMRAAVQSLGGTKRVGAMLWPDLSPENAGRRMNDCLSDKRAERLQLSQVMRVLAWAKDAGFHGPMTWICGEVGYEARPVAHAEEVDRVAQVVEQSTKTLAAALVTLERLQRVRVGT